jgi:hypothetical protein
MLPEAARTLDEILASQLFVANDFPQPTDTERRGPRGDLPLFESSGVHLESEIDESDE